MQVIEIDITIFCDVEDKVLNLSVEDIEIRLQLPSA